MRVSFFMGRHYARRGRIITLPPEPLAVGLAEGYRRAGETASLTCTGTESWFFCPHLPNISSRLASVVLPGQGSKEMLA